MKDTVPVPATTGQVHAISKQEKVNETIRRTDVPRRKRKIALLRIRMALILPVS